MSRRLLVYGATGYTGRLVVERAVEVGLDVTVAGRDPGRVGELADALGTEARAFDVDDADAVREALKDAICLLNVAGPFRNTAHQLMDACIEAGVHYLDTSAEFATFALAESKDHEAVRAGVMVMSGTGGDVVLRGHGDSGQPSYSRRAYAAVWVERDSLSTSRGVR
jgi:short subunit dehydrogenase-like uncharacterized protein